MELGATQPRAECHSVTQEPEDGLEEGEEPPVELPGEGWVLSGSLPGSSIHGIFQARVLGWGAIALKCMVVVFSSSL